MAKEKSGKKHKKSKSKGKKKKLEKKRREKSSCSSSSSSDSEQLEWVEKKTSITPDKEEVETGKKESEPLERDQWMSLPGLFPCVEKTASRKEKRSDKDEKASILDTPGSSERELNPYWKNGGSGVPQVEKQESTSKNSVMDANWLRRSLRRVEEQAKEQGRALEELAAERWGSLEKIQEMIRVAEQQSPHQYNNESHDRRNRDYRYQSSSDRSFRGSRDHRSSHYRPREDEERANRSEKFKKPLEDSDDYRVTGKSYPSRVKNWKKPEARAREKKDENEEEKEKFSISSKDSHHTSETQPMEVQVDAEDEEVLTEADLNRLGAKLVKAEIMGDDELAATLKMKLERAKNRRKEDTLAAQKQSGSEESVILTTTDQRGVTRPLEPRNPYGETSGGGKKRKKQVQTHESGERVRYFADDDKYSLPKMFEREKGTSSYKDDEAFLKAAVKNKDVDDWFESDISRLESDERQDARDRANAIKQHRRITESIENCELCLESNRLLKHTIVTVGQKVYLSLPQHQSMTVGHCVLAPISHVASQTLLDEDVWDELQEFKKALVRMFKSRNEEPVFFEVYARHRKYLHMKLQCIPLPVEVAETAPMYFKKALLECETEWSVNKKVVDLSKKDVRRAIPRELAYFAVNFGNQGGFAHVIEDERAFPRNFAEEIIGGMLDADHSLWRKPRKESFEQISKKVLSFTDVWKKYDFNDNAQTGK